MENFEKKYKTGITDFFIGFLKIIKKCYQCKNESISFNFFPYIEFNYDTFNEEPNFENWFKKQNEKYLDLNEKYNLECKNCKKITKQKEYKQIIQLPQNLIILLNENEGYKIPEKINYPIFLDLTQTFKKETKFNLVGLVKRMIDKDGSEYYCAIYLDPYQKCWICTDKNNNFGKIKEPKSHTRGMVMLLFYSAQINIGL